MCYFWNLRSGNKNGYICYSDETVDFYFFLIDLLFNYYPKDNDGIPSFEAVSNVYNYFFQVESELKEIVLKEILVKRNRKKGVETQIYSTYKAAGYYLNLTDNKLHFVDSKKRPICWKSSQLKRTILKSGISLKDRKFYLRQILRYDGHFFLAMCQIQKLVKRYDLNLDEEIFHFMQQYFPVSTFDYTKQSHANYCGVRKRWQELLQVVDDKGRISKLLTNTISEEIEFKEMNHRVMLKIKDYINELREKGTFLRQKRTFIVIYRKLVLKNKDKSYYVNLYDISKEMKMSYQRFQLFLTRFYQEERMVRNIFFINIVSTIDQRKRFYIGKVPVLKIKISRKYGA